MQSNHLYQEYVDVLSVRFPRATRWEAMTWVRDRIVRGETTPLCFPDMSTLNIASRDPDFRRLLQERFFTLNDGAGLAWAARRQGRPLLDNLNGTDLVPLLLANLPVGTRVYMLGASSANIVKAADHLTTFHRHLRLVGARDGYFGAEEEPVIVGGLVEARPQLVLVAMGNPRQVRFIDRHRDDPRLAGVTWLAVGGLLDYWAGALRRSPEWMRKAGLEWAWIAMNQPRKLVRYGVGVPEFMLRCLVAELRQLHAFSGRPMWSGG